MLFRGSPSLYFQTLQVYKTCFQTSLTYLMTVLACIHNDYELFVCECLLWVIMRGGPNLCPVELQLIISDPPGLLGFQPLRSFLLHVILPQPVGLNHLLKGLLTAGAQTAQANTFSIHPAVWTPSAQEHNPTKCHTSKRILLWFLGLGVDISKDSDIREVNSEFGQESCHAREGGERKRNWEN